jgi:hypothetical protein
MGRPELYPYKKMIGFNEEQIARIEKWRGEQRPIPNFSDAVRDLIEAALESTNI